MLTEHVYAAVSIACISVAFPFAVRIFLSPWTFFLLFLPILSISFLAGLLSFLLLGYTLDKQRFSTSRKLSPLIRPLVFSTPAAWQAVLTRLKWSSRAAQDLPLIEPEYPLVSQAFNDVLNLIIRDFVLSWYSDLSTSPAFPSAVSEMIHSAAQILLQRLKDKDIASLAVRRILPELTGHVDQFRYSETVLRGAGLERHLTQSEELDLLLASRYSSKGGHLHPAVENLATTFTRQSEEAHLRKLVEAILPYILPKTDADSKAVRIAAREIVACCVLAPVMDMLSDPDFWNRTIDQIAGAAIRQQKMISRVRDVLENQSPRKTISRRTTKRSETINLRTDSRNFESFLRSIGRCDSLLDARRLKNDIVGEIRRTRALLAKHSNEDWIDGKKTEDVVAFLDRLYTAKRKVENRIIALGGHDDALQVLPEIDAGSSYTLRDILTSPSSLSYFMEFVDRRGRSLLVQFWLTVESFKNPLESVDTDSSGEDIEQLVMSSVASTLREDLKMINDLYFASSNPPAVLSPISQKHVDAIRLLALQDSLTISQERKARRSVMLAQRQVEQDMDHDFEDFQRSDLWFRAVSDLIPKTGGHQTIPQRPSGTLAPKASLSLGLLGSLVPVFKSESFRSQPNRKPPIPHAETIPHFTSVPPLALRPQISYDFNPVLPSPSPTLSRVPSALATSSNLDILMSSTTDEDGASSRAPLFDETEDGRLLTADAEESHRMEAIQAAVTDIIASEDKLGDERPRARELSSEESLRKVISDSDARSTSSRGQRKPLFSDAPLDLPSPVEEVGEDESKMYASTELPSELQLPDAISHLKEKIDHLQSQDTMLDTLIGKAELAGDLQELRLLKKSKSALERELRQLNFQLLQYEQQDSASKLVTGQTKASIVNSTIGEEEGKQVVRYLIEVQKFGSSGSFASGWIVARRYSEFLFLHQQLKEQYIDVKPLEFPGKNLMTSPSSHLLDTRRTGLEKYLQELLGIPVVCESPELRAFLSRESPFLAKSVSGASLRELPSFPGQNLVRSVYRSFTESIDEVFFGPSMLDVMIGRLTRQAAETAGLVGPAATDEDRVEQALRAKAAPEQEPADTLSHLSGDLTTLAGEPSTSPFAAPICDLVLAVFELDRRDNWLRRQAIVIILQQVFGDTVERKVRESIKAYLDEPHVLSYLNIFKDGMWPNGRLKPPSAPRIVDEKARTRDEANRKLSTLLPDMTANIMGRSNARRAARRIFAVLQNRRLNQHIMYTILDEIVVTLFPEAAKAMQR